MYWVSKAFFLGTNLETVLRTTEYKDVAVYIVLTFEGTFHELYIILSVILIMQVLH